MALLVAGCSGPSAVDLTSADVHGSANLSTAERKAHVAYCVSLKDEFLSSPKVVRAKTQPDERFHDQVDRVCDCLVNAFEDRTSKMQFLMIMESLGKIKQALIEGKDSPTMAPFKAAAVKHGMSVADFARARRQAGEIANSAINNCGRFARTAG